MAPASPPPVFRPPLALGVFLVVALCIGLAAAFLAAPAVTPGPTPAVQGPGAVSFAVVGWFCVGLMVVIVVGLVVRRLFAVSSGPVGRSIVSYLVVFLLAVLFLVAVRFVNPTAVGFDAPTDPGLPGSGNASGANQTTLNNTTFLPTPLAPHVPGWWLYVGLAAAVVIALVVVPLVLTRRSQAIAPAAAPAAVRAPIAEALAALTGPGSSDARGIVIRLYARLLERVGPQLDSVETATPREIERECVDRFGIRADHARALTRLFEEARYSSHPFSGREAEEARSALTLALEDIDRAGNRA